MKRSMQTLLFAALCAVAADSTATSNAWSEHRLRVDRAVSARDYQAWKAEHDAYGGNGRVAAAVTPENFETYAQMREAMLAGRVEDARNLRAALGVQCRGAGMGQGAGRGMRMNARNASDTTGSQAMGGRGQGRGMGQGNCRR